MNVTALLQTVSVEDIVLALLVMNLTLLAWTGLLTYKLRRLTRGTHGRNLEASLISVKRGHDELQRFRSEIERYLKHVEKRLAQSIRGIETVRFNPFKGSGMGGDQSFASAFINEEGDGVVLSTLYARDHVSVFAKPVKHFTSEYELTTEERAALGEAKRKVLEHV